MSISISIIIISIGISISISISISIIFRNVVLVIKEKSKLCKFSLNVSNV